jgi:hypothetical protein
MWVLVQGYPVGGYDWGSRPDQGLPGYGRPDNSLPGGGPVDPGYGRPGWSPVDPGYGQGGGFRPDNSLPWAPGHPGNRPPGSWGGRPDNSLPGWPVLPGQDLPWAPVRPDQGLPGSQPGIDNSLPGGRPPHASGQPIVPGATPYGTAVATAPPEKVNAEEGAWVLVNVQGTLVWAWAQKPQQSSGGGSVDNTLPGSQPGVDNTLPGSPGHPSGQPVPPPGTAQPKK